MNKTTTQEEHFRPAGPKDTNDAAVCFASGITRATGIWQGENPLVGTLPTFVLQVTVTLLATRLFLFVLKPFKQPRIVAELLAGVVLSPGVLGSVNDMAQKLFPAQSLELLETLAIFGLVLHVFLVGLEMDLTAVMGSSRKAVWIAISGIIIPLALGTGLFFLMDDSEYKSKRAGSVYWGLSLTVTGVPMLTKVLANLKLLHTDMGRLALSSALINEILVWIMFTVAIPLSVSIQTTHWSVLATAAFTLFSFLVVRPAIAWLLRRTPEGENLTEFQVCLVLLGVVLSGIVTDIAGTNSIIGAFVFGLVFPVGIRANEIVERLEEFVSGILLPLYFVTSGIRINLQSLVDGISLWAVAAVIIFACLAKVISTFIVYYFYKMPLQEGMALGVILNTKDVLVLIILNLAKDRQAFNNQMFTTMVVSSLVMTGVVIPAINSIYRPRVRLSHYKHRSIEKSQSDAELRILTCMHLPRNVPGIINLLEACYPNKRSPLTVFGLHLVELTGRASAMLVVHNTHRTTSFSASAPNLASSRSTQAQSEQIITAFEGFQNRNPAVTVQPLTVMSPYSTMDEDIFNIAEDKRVALIVLPFHKGQTADGKMDEGNAAFRRVNQNVLDNAPSSVAIFVDRGFGALGHHNRRICMLFFCGPDDREALSFSWRLAGHPTATLNVIRFIPGENAADMPTLEDFPADSNGILSAISDHERQKSLDDDFVENFRIRTSGDQNILYSELELNNGEETVKAIREMEHGYDLYIVGRGQKVLSPLTAGLNEWSDCPELGAIGDILVTSDFASRASVVVMQQFSAAGPGAAAEPGSPDRSKDNSGFDHMNWRQADGNFEPFVNRNRSADNGWDA